MTQPGYIKVTFGALSDARGDIASSHATLNQRLSDLRASVAPMAATWDGAAKEAWHGYQQMWDQAWMELNGVLNTIGGAVDTSNSNYQQTESTNAGMWG